MTLRVSTRYKEMILGPNAFEDIFDGGRILVYSGTQPGSANNAATGTLLAQVTNLGLLWSPGGSSAGLNFSRDGAWVLASPSQSWRLLVSVAGTAGWFRLVGPAADDGSASFVLPRIDGAIAASGAAEMLLSDTALVSGASMPVQQFLFSLPPLGA